MLLNVTSDVSAWVFSALSSNNIVYLVKNISKIFFFVLKFHKADIFLEIFTGN